MRNRDYDLALRALIAAAEANNQSIKNLTGRMEARLDSIDDKLDGIITRLDEFHAEFAIHRHGDDGEVI